MSSTQAAEATESHDHHPTPRQYVNIAIVLAILTALEVSTYFFDFGVIGIPLLIILMIVKFLYVAGWFMHLKFDSPVFGRMMYTGLFLALGLYSFALVIMLFDQSTTV